MRHAAEGDLEAGQETIPWQVWINPKWAPASDAHQVPAWEFHATNPDTGVLVSCYDRINVWGYYGDSMESIAERKQSKSELLRNWHARAIQGLTPYFDGRPPQYRIANPEFIIARRAKFTYWEGMAPFRLMLNPSNHNAQLGMRDDIRGEVASIADRIWGESREQHRSLELIGFIRFEKDPPSITPQALTALEQLLPIAIKEPKRFRETPDGRDALVRLFCLNEMHPYENRFDSSGSVPVLVKEELVDGGSGGSTEARDPSLSLSGGDTMTEPSTIPSMQIARRARWVSMLVACVFILCGSLASSQSWRDIWLILIGVSVTLGIGATVLVAVRELSRKP